MTIPKLQSVPVASTGASDVAKALIVAQDRFVPSPMLRVVRPTPVLDRLCLPPERLATIRPGLEQLGLSHEDGKLARSEGGKTTTFHFTLVRNGVRRALLFLKDETLTIYARETKLALEEVRNLFQGSYDVLYVFHNSNPNATYKNLMRGEWPQKYRIKTRFIALSELDDFKDMTIEEQVTYLRRELDLAEALLQRPAAAEKAPAEDIALAKLRKLAEKIAKRREFTDEGVRGRRVFVEGAGLHMSADFDFDGGPKTVAEALTFALLDRGGLGQLLERMRDLEDISPDDREFIVGLLDQYTFVDRNQATA